MTHQEIKELAGHRAVSPWMMKLVGDAVAKEREACAKIVEESSLPDTYSQECLPEIANDIRARGEA